MNKVFNNKLLAGLFIAILSFTFVGCSDDDDDERIDPKSLPATAQTFVQTHFTEATIVYAEKDKIPDLNGGIYEVYLSNGVEIEFDSNGVWTEVYCKRSPVPASIMSLVPEEITKYAIEKYPNFAIVELKKEVGGGFSIELINDLEIYFDKDGKFIGEKW